MYDKSTAAPVAIALQIEGEVPLGQTFERLRASGLAPVEGRLAPARLRRVRVQGLARKHLDLHVKSVKIVCTESRDQNAAHLVIVTGNLQFFRGAPDCQVVDDDLALIESALVYAR